MVTAADAAAPGALPLSCVGVEVELHVVVSDDKNKRVVVSSGLASMAVMNNVTTAIAMGKKAATKIRASRGRKCKDKRTC
jgi:hypothetical protein